MLEFDGKEVPSMRRLPLIVAETEIDKSVKVVVWRNKKRVTLSVKVGALEEGEAKMASKADGPGDAGETSVDDLGLTLSAMTATARDRFKLDKTAKGVVVTAVDGAGVAAAEGIRPGDLILEVSQEEVTSVSDVVDKIGVAKKAGRKQVLVLVEGQSGTRFVVLRIKAG
jgi:serine protease Do